MTNPMNPFTPENLKQFNEKFVDKTYPVDAEGNGVIKAYPSVSKDVFEYFLSQFTAYRTALVDQLTTAIKSAENAEKYPTNNPYIHLKDHIHEIINQNHE